MELHFLGAGDGIPLTKKFREIAPGQYEKTSYPHVVNVISTRVDVDDINQFKTAIETMSEEGFCLLKGRLDRQLENEPRAGHTDPHAETDWICLDVDFDVTEYETPRDFLKAFDKDVGKSDFIYQHSASYGITATEGWRGHLYVMLERPMSPQLLKLWLIEKNLRVPGLVKHVRLSATGMSLRYPLDVTTCQNDKLIYIARPECENFADPVKERIEISVGEQRKALLDINPNAATNQKLVRDKVEQMREDAGLERKRQNIEVTFKGLEICKNPDPMTVTGKKEARGFVYLNINGGDSWAYFFPMDKPELVFNFKGEPALYLRDIDPALLAEYTAAAPTTFTPTIDNDSPTERVPLAFREVRRDAYYNGWYNPEEDKVSIHQTNSKSKIKDFLGQHGYEMPQHIPDWRMEFDPTRMDQIDLQGQWINTFSPTPYLRAADSEVPNAEIPEVISKILWSLCGEKEILDHFVNWMAYIFQNRKKTGTAWIFQGVQGTGKGLLYSKILSPLFGEEHVFETTMERFDDQFNSFLERNLVLFVDEANVADSRKGDKTVNKLKNMITEGEQVIRAMRSNPYTAPSFNNLVFASNQVDMIPLEASDRRFNVAPRQEESIAITNEEVKQISRELQRFADMLMSHQVDSVAACTIMHTKAREALISMGETTVASFFNAIRTGNLGYFCQFIRTQVPKDHTGISYIDFKDTVTGWIDSVDKQSTVSRDQLMTCYAYMQGLNELPSPTKFNRMCSRYGVRIESVKADDDEAPVRGCFVEWTLSDEDKAIYQSDNVVPLPEPKDA